VTATLKRDAVDDADVGGDDSTMLIARSGCRKAVLDMVTCFVSIRRDAFPALDNEWPMRRWRLLATVKRANVSTCMKHDRTSRPPNHPKDTMASCHCQWFLPSMSILSYDITGVYRFSDAW
jgi:hypothetical protein